MKRKNRAASASTTSPEGKKKKVASANDPESSTSATKAIDYTSSSRVVESLLAVTDLENFFEETWEKKPHFVKRENADFYGALFSKKDVESLLKKEEIQFTEDVSLSRYVEGKTEPLNEEGRVNLKHIKAAGVAVQFHQPDRFKDEVWRLIESLETYFRCLVAADAFIFQPGSQGLAPQFDEMETFILQLEGKTKWKLFKPLQELPQEASPDLELSDLGEPTDEFDMEPGDFLYFPRGTVYFPAPIEDKDHAVHLAITTFQENSWGNMLTSALSNAVEKAMESDVEYRRGLPVNLASFMGSGVNGNETEDLSEQNGDQKTDNEATAVEKEAANPRTAFNNTLVNLLKGLVRHLNPDKAVDDMLRDFFWRQASSLWKRCQKREKEERSLRGK